MGIRARALEMRVGGGRGGRVEWCGRRVWGEEGAGGEEGAARGEGEQVHSTPHLVVHHMGV